MSELIAAGTVLWRFRPVDVTRPGEPPDSQPVEREVEIALVHRPKYDDWSLPKGKCEPGEHPCVTAVRETREETGFHGPLARGLGQIEYEVPGADGTPTPKVVHYWAMPALGGAFTPSLEVDEIRWLSPDNALTMLTREADRAPVQTFLQAPPETFTLLLIRHADAGDRRDWHGPDDERPLNEHGRQQARNLAAIAACFGLSNVVSADVTRCLQTIGPTATALGLPIDQEPVFAEGYGGLSTDRAVARIRELVSKGNLALCSQGGVIPEILEFLRRRDGVPLIPRSRKGSVWMLSFVPGGRLPARSAQPSSETDFRLVAAQYLQGTEPAIPVN